MKRRIILTLFVLLNTVSVFASEASDFLTDLYTKEYKCDVKIKSKREFCDKYEQKIGGQYISSIVYGQADMKIKGHKKQKVSYICLMENDCKIVWGYVIPR